MALVYRIIKGQPLSYEEGDGNTSYLDKKITIAPTPPNTSNDSASGFNIDSYWIDSESGIEYICVDSTVGNAVWNEKVTTFINPSGLESVITSQGEDGDYYGWKFVGDNDPNKGALGDNAIDMSHTYAPSEGVPYGAIGNTSLALGTDCSAGGYGSMAIGRAIIVKQGQSYALGDSCVLDGQWCYSFGKNNELIGNSSSVFGYGNGCYSDYVNIYGNNNDINVSYASIHGNNNTINAGENDNSSIPPYILGYSNIGAGTAFIAGSYNEISASSYAFGTHLTSGNDDCFLFGKLNIPYQDDAFTFGYGYEGEGNVYRDYMRISKTGEPSFPESSIEGLKLIGDKACATLEYVNSTGGGYTKKLLSAVESEFVLSVNDFAFIITNSSDTLALLPSGMADFSELRIIDYTGVFDINALELEGNGNTIMGSTSNLIVNTKNASLHLVFVNGDWILV